MAVQSWLRSLSNVQYIYNVFLLEKRILQITYNVPSKYRKAFGDKLIGLCSDALYHGTTANRIRIRNEGTYDSRYLHLTEMSSCVDEVARQTYLWLETVREHDGISKDLDDKFYKYEDDIGGRCDEITRLINGVIRSDHEIYKELVKGE